MSKKHSLILFYALAISIILMLTGFLVLVVRAFAPAGVSNFLFFAVLGILVLTPVIYFVWRHAGGTAINQRIFEATQPVTCFGKDRRRRGMHG
jgi:hypothetical protein